MTSKKQVTPKVTSFQPAAPGNANGSAAPYAAPVRQTVDLAGLHPHSRNYKAHNAKQIDRIARSLATFGQGRSVVIWHDTIIAGHGVVAAARSLGWQTIQADVLDPDMPRDVALAYLVADNELARLADPDQAALAALLQELGGEDDALLAAMGWDDAELRELLREVGAADVGAGDAEPQVDRASELLEIWGVKTGDLWALGEHRLICGDCTDAAVVARVMAGDVAEVIVTDPPYGIMALGGRRQTHQARGIEFIENDDLAGDALVEFLAVAIAIAPVSGSASFYVCYGWKSQAEFTQALKQCGLTLRATITWVKNVFGLSAKNNVGYRPQTEFIYFATKSPEYIWKWHGGGTQSDAWHIDRPVERVGNHPTNKPIELPAKCIENSSDSGDVIYDPFAGSGTTGIACHNLHRRARMVEISPAYCSVILQRFADAFPGLPIARLEGAP